MKALDEETQKELMSQLKGLCDLLGDPLVRNYLKTTGMKNISYLTLIKGLTALIKGVNDYESQKRTVALGMINANKDRRH